MFLLTHDHRGGQGLGPWWWQQFVKSSDDPSANFDWRTFSLTPPRRQTSDGASRLGTTGVQFLQSDHSLGQQVPASQRCAMAAMTPVDGDRTTYPLKDKESDSSDSRPPYSALLHIPIDLRIEIIHQDSSIVVISKPGGLRSVPGHARNNAVVPGLPTGLRKRPRQDDDSRNSAESALSGQRSWIAAIQSFRSDGASADDTSDTAHRCLLRLAENTALVASAPRKYQVFCRYLHRNKIKIFGADEAYSEEIAESIYTRIKEKHKSFLPEPTKLEESALGQIQLLGILRTDQPQCGNQRPELYIIHRLDCETSGVMVFARTQTAAATLSKSWRQRDEISKQYLAHVQYWIPYHDQGLESGTIDLPLKPSDERIKWQTCLATDDGAKPSTTLWRVLRASPEKRPVILELVPVTGRTHQLRLHCAAFGSGITGDTLYAGKNSLRSETSQNTKEFPRTGLYLHAHKLSFVHPSSCESMDFIAEPPPWFYSDGL